MPTYHRPANQHHRRVDESLQEAEFVELRSGKDCGRACEACGGDSPPAIAETRTSVLLVLKHRAPADSLPGSGAGRFTVIASVAAILVALAGGYTIVFALGKGGAPEPATPVVVIQPPSHALPPLSDDCRSPMRAKERTRKKTQAFPDDSMCGVYRD